MSRVLPVKAEDSMSTSEKILERHLWLCDTTSAASPIDIYIEIGRPLASESGEEARCSVFIRGLMSSPLDVFGSDSFGAMQCALDFAESELKRLRTSQSIQWPGGEPYF